MKQEKQDRLAAVDGLRALTSLSLVSLHTLLVVSLHLPNGAHPAWTGYAQHPLYGAPPSD